MKEIGLYTSISSNKIKSILLILLFPTILFWTVLLAFIIAWFQEEAIKETINLFYILLPIILIWLIISFAFHKQIMFYFSWAQSITRESHPRIYNIVENLCISRWLKTPNLWIIPDKWMNAFATWWNTENSWIVFSQWLIDNLDDNEIKAVAAHELTHIINKDSLVMIIIVIFIWIIATIWELILRSWINVSRRGNRNSWKWAFATVLIWLTLVIIWYVIFPLLKLSISRKREYLADAWAVELTKDPNSLISALLKISKKPFLNTIKQDSIWNMCIEDPFMAETKKWWFKRFFHNLFSTHPSIEDRVIALKRY